MHLNVGKGIVNPSLGVRSLDLADLLPKGAGAVATVIRMLGALSVPACTYSLAAGLDDVANDLRGRRVAELTRLQDRQAVVEMLQAEAQGRDQMVPAYAAFLDAFRARFAGPRAGREASE